MPGPDPGRPLRGLCDARVTSREPRGPSRRFRAPARPLVRFPPCRGTRNPITSGLETGGARRAAGPLFAGFPAGIDPLRRQLRCLRFPVPLIRFLVPRLWCTPSRPLSRVLPRALPPTRLLARSLPRAGFRDPSYCSLQYICSLNVVPLPSPAILALFSSIATKFLYLPLYLMTLCGIYFEFCCVIRPQRPPRAWALNRRFSRFSCPSIRVYSHCILYRIYYICT